MQQTEEKKTGSTGKPLQRIPWSEKIADKHQWWKNNIDHYISISNFNFGNTGTGKKDLRSLYRIYNHQFPMEWFSHITDPLNAANPQHKKYPAKIRPTTMLRTNIDLLLGEYPGRPFIYQVVNMGEDAYNSYLENLNKSVQSNIEEHFLAVAQEAMRQAGLPFEEIPQDQEIELPSSVRERFNASYKDNIAIRAQKWLKRAVREYHVRSKFLKMFKDWLITGHAYSYKNLEFGNLRYDHVSPLEIDYDKSVGQDYVEDGEWVIRRRLLTVSDVVDELYDELTEENLNELDMRTNWASAYAMYNYLDEMYSSHNVYAGKVPVYHVCWKGKKFIYHYTYTDPLTGETQELTLDEDVKPADYPGLQLVKKETVNEVYEGTRVGDNIYCRMRPVPIQRNEMNNFSVCKLPYNGRMYSNTHSENISPMEMGIPSAIMHMITNYALEKTIAKNKGKILLIDQNVVPNKNGWNDEKFFYYGDALGYALVNRNQAGVDKSFNQYQVLDMSTFQHIKELIEIRDSFRTEWDELIGVNAQRKAQVGSSDGLGTTEIALNRSAVITAMIFILFEEFTERELQGLIDFSRFVNVEGIRGIYNLDDFDSELLTIDPNSYCNAELGIFVKYSLEEMQILREYKGQLQAMIQNGVKQSTILEIQKANNLEELMAKLKRIEEIELEEASQQADAEAERAQALEEVITRREKLKNLLEIDQINAEWDRRDANEMIKGEYQVYSAANLKGDGDADNNGVPDTAEIADRVMSMQELFRKQQADVVNARQKQKEHEDWLKLEYSKLNDKKLDRKSKEKIAADKNKVALKNRVSGEKK